MLSGWHETWAQSALPRLCAAAAPSSMPMARSGKVSLWSAAVMNTGRPVAAARLSILSFVMLGPTVSWKMPRPSSPSTPTSARISSSSARREGIGTPPSP